MTLVKPEPIEAVYILHFSKPVGRGRFGQAQHYIGYTKNLGRRFKEHTNLAKYVGSPLVRTAIERGAHVTIARIFRGKDRTFERRLKNRKETPRLCPVCNPKLPTWEVDNDTNISRS